MAKQQMRVPIKFGRLITNASPLVIPMHLAGDMQNVDIDETGAASRRAGTQRTLEVQFSNRVAFIHGFDDTTGDRVYVAIDDTGVYRE